MPSHLVVGGVAVACKYRPIGLLPSRPLMPSSRQPRLHHAYICRRPLQRRITDLAKSHASLAFAPIQIMATTGFRASESKAILCETFLTRYGRHERDEGSHASLLMGSNLLTS